MATTPALTLGRSELLESDDEDFFPIVAVQRSLRAELQKGDVVVCIDFSGIDQLTDVFFRILADGDIRFPSMTELSCTGCVHLTDKGVEWMMIIFPRLKKVALAGCPNLTENSLAVLLNCLSIHRSLEVVDMMATNVAVVPRLIENTDKTILKLDGCPLITPTFQDYCKYGNSYFKERASDLRPLTSYKVVVWSEDSFPCSLAGCMVEGVWQPATSPVSVYTDIPLGADSDRDGDPSTKLNIFEVQGERMEVDMFLGHGCIIVLPFLLSDDLDQIQTMRKNRELKQRVLRILSHINPSGKRPVVVLAGVRPPSETETTDPEKDKKTVSEIEAGVVAHIHNHADFTYMNDYQVVTEQEDIMFSLGFRKQLELGRVSLRHEYGVSITRNICSVLLDASTEKSRREIQQLQFVQDALDRLQKNKVFRPEMAPEFHHVVARVSESDACTVQEFMDKVLCGELKEALTPAAVKRILEACHCRGLCVYHPNSSLTGGSVITQCDRLAHLLCQLTEQAPLKVGSAGVCVPCVGDGMPCWTLQALEAAIKQTMGDSLQPSEVVDMLLRANVLLVLACERQSASDENCVYLPLSALPTQPCIELAYLWPDDRPDTDKQIDRYYTFMQGVPVSFFAAVQRHFGKISQFSLLWKNGAVIQLGAIDLLLELATDALDVQVVIVSVRGPKPPSEDEQDNMESWGASGQECMWAVLNTYTAILDYLLKKFNIHARVTVPCQTYGPTQNRNAVLKVGTTFHQLSLMTVTSENSLSCAHCDGEQKEKTRAYSRQDLMGPAHRRFSPGHRQAVVQRASVAPVFKVKPVEKMLSFTKCFQCQNCVQHGVHCPQNGLRGATARDCGCETEVALCPVCGVCPHCTTYLANVETSLHPGLSSAKLFSCFESAHAFGVKESRTGNLVKKMPAEGQWRHQFEATMSPDHFNHFSVTLLKGNAVNIQLKSGEPCSDWCIEYSASEGKLCIMENDRIMKETVCTAAVVGDTVGIHMRYPSSSTNKFQVGSQVQLTISLRGGVLYSWCASYKTLVPCVVLSDECHVLINAPGIRVESELPATEQVEATRCMGLADLLIQMGGSTIRKVALVDCTWTDLLRLKDLYEANKDKLEALDCYGSGKAMYRRLYPFGTLTKDAENDPVLKECMDLLEIVPWARFLKRNRNVFPPDLYLRGCLDYECSGSLTTPAALHCQLAQRHKQVTKQLFQQGQISLSGSAIALLPKRLDSNMRSFVRRSDVSDLSTSSMHPLCYVRGDVGEILVLPPSYEMTEDSAPYWQVHFVAGPGVRPPSDLLEKHWFLVLGWHALLAMQNQIFLPSGLVEGADSLSLQQVSMWVERAIQLQTSILLMSAHPVKYFLHCLSGHDLHTSVSEVTALVESNLEGTSLETRTPTLGTEEVLLCPGHANSNLVDCGLTEFPSEQFSLYCQVVGSLQLEGNQLTELPQDFFRQFSGLIDLDITQNRLKALPMGIGCCKKLKFVRFANNLLTDLPPDLSDINNSLIRLDISANPMTQVPAVVMEMTKLRRLYLQYLLLTELPGNIGCLADLEYCHLSGNCLRRLPRSFVKLQKLKVLSINGVPWYELSHANTFLSKRRMEEKYLKRYNLQDWIDGHQQVKETLYSFFDQDVDEKQLGRLNSHLYAIFPRLGHYGRSAKTPYSKLGGFPREILALKNLQYLSLQYQGLTFIPDSIETVSGLEEINLSHNPYLTSLPGSMGSLALKRVEVGDCPSLKTPPREIQARGSNAVLAYLQRLQTGSVQCKRTKLMLVGLGGAGKTSLVNCFMTDATKSGDQTVQEITDGIDISSWKLAREDGESVTFSVWDFAGQTVYYNTHQFFLSNRAVYLLVWNIRLGHEHAGLNFWLSSISVHAPQAPIFVVGTHLDQVAKIELPMDLMQERYPQIVGFHFVSSRTRQGVPELKSSMLNTALQQQYMGEMIPQVWLNFEKAVINKRSDASVIPYTQLENVASSSGIFDKSETVEAVQFLHELGTLQHFSNESLRDQVVVDPQWIVDVMACVVSVKDSPIKDGRFLHSQVGTVWSTYPENLHQWLLKLTEEFDLTFPLPDQSLNIVPCLLPEKHAQFDWPEAGPQSGIRETSMVYTFDYLPAGLFNRAQVRLYQFSDSSSMWKRGSLLKKNGNLALITQPRESELLVQVQGPRPENVLFLVHEVFEGLIMESFQGVTYDYLLPCPDCLQAQCKDPHMFSAHTIRRATQLRAPFLQCTKLFHAVTLTDFHTLMPPTSTKDYDMHLANAVRGLTDLHKNLVTDIFMSYSAQDLTESSGRQKVNPHKIRDDLVAAGYRCYLPKDPSKLKDEQTVIAVRDSQVFMALVSDAYVNDTACCDLLTYAHMTLKKPLVLVVLGSGQDWRKSRVGILLSDEVFINMQREELYDSRFTELVKKVREKKTTDEEVNYPPCFISYCWQNSQLAVSRGTKKVEDALGYGDPRQLKEFLSNNGVECWLDVERVGRRGLFEDIAEGLRHAGVVVACVSDQYANSPNCVMEYRFASRILNIPTVLAIVGTGNSWRSSDVGMLSLQNPQPEINFQEETTASFDKLLQVVRSRLPQESLEGDAQRGEDVKKQESSVGEQDNVSFQELFELAQRKLLRQVAQYAETSGELYPRLLVVDFVENAKQESTSSSSKPPLRKRPSSALKSSVHDINLRQKQMGFKILCEHEEGWHNYCDPIQAPGHFDESQLGRYSPYLARILALLQHSSQMYLGCTSGQDGRSFLQWLEELPQATLSDFGDTYREFRKEVITADTSKSMGQLARCHMPNGKITWLCPEHQKLSRVTILANDVVLPGTHAAAEVGKEIHMVDQLNTAEMVDIFQSNLLNWPTLEEEDEEDFEPSDAEEGPTSPPPARKQPRDSNSKVQGQVTKDKVVGSAGSAGRSELKSKATQEAFKSGFTQNPNSVACDIL